MFERYTEKARRVIFFARYEAAQYGSPYIETEHLLLGLMREDRALFTRFSASVDHQQIRTQISECTPIREQVSTSIDLPLSNECKRILAYGAEEAERLRHKHIGTEHLLLGILREKGTFASQMLTERGVRPEEVREQLRVEPHEQPFGAAPTIKRQQIEIHGVKRDKSNLLARANSLHKFIWEKRPWKSRDILRDIASRRVMFYTGQEYDATKFRVEQGGWDREKCVICGWELLENEGDPKFGVGYTNGLHWVCTECFEKFLASGPPPEDDVYT
jgi:Clp amino terminal domain, pathogenicity island component